MEKFVTGLLSDTGDVPGRLLQYLCAIQHRYSYVARSAVQVLSDRLHIPAAQINAVVDFYAFLYTKPRGEFNILFSDSITDRMQGNISLLNHLCDALKIKPGIPRADHRVTVDVTSCTGICDQGPALLVNDQVIAGLDEEKIQRIAELIEVGTPVSGWPASFFVVEDNIQRSDKLLSAPITPGSAIDTCLDKGSDKLLKILDQSGLRGRGGAGFKTATKWRFCKDTTADEHYVVCNADEGEPGTFKDRVLLNTFADDVFEGMTLCAAVIGARQGYLYLRGEYRYLLEPLEASLAERRAANLLGDYIRGHKNFSFDIEIHLGAGAYICGEESALIESLEGKRGIPRIRPPFPVSNGFRNQPTVVNNVETFVAAAKISVLGSEWFNTTGTDESAGTKLLSISGDCSRPGIYEYPFGTSISKILEDCGASNVQAVQVAGAAGSIIPPGEFDRKICFEDISTGGSIIIFNDQRNLLDMVKNFAHFFCHESCGFCTPCRVGTSLMKDLVDKVVAGHATEYDLQEMRNIGQVMQQASHCGLGATAPNPVLETLHKFPHIYAQQLSNKTYEPAFDLDAAVEISRKLTGRDDPAAHIQENS